MTPHNAHENSKLQAPRTIRAHLKTLRHQRISRHMKERACHPDSINSYAADERLPEVELRQTKTQDRATSVPALGSLPGAGPSLIWMLNECGITSIDDLAVADPAQLSISLGVVGQILDVDAWIEFAKATALTAP